MISSENKYIHILILYIDNIVIIRCFFSHFIVCSNVVTTVFSFVAISIKGNYFYDAIRIDQHNTSLREVSVSISFLANTPLSLLNIFLSHAENSHKETRRSEKACDTPQKVPNTCLTSRNRPK